MAGCVSTAHVYSWVSVHTPSARVGVCTCVSAACLSAHVGVMSPSQLSPLTALFAPTEVQIRHVQLPEHGGLPVRGPVLLRPRLRHQGRHAVGLAGARLP